MKAWKYLINEKYKENEIINKNFTQLPPIILDKINITVNRRVLQGNKIFTKYFNPNELDKIANIMKRTSFN